MPVTAFKMTLKPGMQQEYQARHNAIWPELKVLLKTNGIIEYSIFFDADTNLLFAVQKRKEVADNDDLKNNPVMQKWWHHMADLMEVNADSSPVIGHLENMFILD